MMPSEYVRWFDGSSRLGVTRHHQRRTGEFDVPDDIDGPAETQWGVLGVPCLSHLK